MAGAIRFSHALSRGIISHFSDPVDPYEDIILKNSKFLSNGKLHLDRLDRALIEIYNNRLKYLKLEPATSAETDEFFQKFEKFENLKIFNVVNIEQLRSVFFVGKIVHCNIGGACYAPDPLIAPEMIPINTDYHVGMIVAVNYKENRRGSDDLHAYFPTEVLMA